MEGPTGSIWLLLGYLADLSAVEDFFHLPVKVLYRRLWHTWTTAVRFPRRRGKLPALLDILINRGFSTMIRRYPACIAAIAGSHVHCPGCR